MDQVSFITASGFVVAILLVWANLWTTTAQVYEDKRTSMFLVKYSLAYLYWAVLASLIAFVIAIFREPVPSPALGFLGFSLMITIFMVGSSLTGVILKVLHDLELWSTLEPWDPLSRLSSKYYGRIILVVVIPLLALTAWIIIVSYSGIFQS